MMKYSLTILLCLTLLIGCRRFNPPQPDVPLPNIDVASYAEGLYEVAKVYPGALVCESPRSKMLDELAQAHSEYQARTDRCGHDGFSERAAKIQQAFGMSSAEIAAQSYPNEDDHKPLEVGRETFEAWHGSAGHWAIASKRHAFAGYGMACSKTGRWFGTILTAN